MSQSSPNPQDSRPRHLEEVAIGVASRILFGNSKRGWRRVARGLTITSLLLVVFSAASFIGADQYCSRPDFCGTCHIMDPYYKSWSQDVHGAKVGARCVDCHYAPGERMTFHAKFKGLSQVASYFSGRYGTARPRAHVNDSSCLTSRCHGAGDFLNKTFVIGEERMEPRVIGNVTTQVERTPTVHYNHGKHLKVDGRVAEVRSDIEKVEARLKAALPRELFENVRAASESTLPVDEQKAIMQKALGSAGTDSIRADANELMRGQHSLTRLLQLSGLNCAGCHTYDGSGKHHLTVYKEACFTCHFTNQEFNTGTGECLKCHEPPVRQVAVHSPAGTPDMDGIMMDHCDIVARRIDCASCHRDLVQGSSAVTLEQCTHCHDQDKFLGEFSTRTATTVQMYHRVHEDGDRARCSDCHGVLQHRLADPMHVGSSASLLRPVVNDCQHCHPKHHLEQVDLLLGIGGAGVARAMPSAMFESRINCQACHTKVAVDNKGDELEKATQVSCVACHSSDYEKLFQQWRAEIQSELREAEAALARVHQQRDKLQKEGRAIPSCVQEAVDNAEQNIRLISSGNGVHNRKYTVLLLDMSTRQLDDALMEMAVK